MKKFMFCIVMMMMVFTTSFAKYYVGRVTTTVNFREGPATYYDVIRSLPKGSYIFIDTDENIGNFYRAVYIDQDETGYVSKDYVKLVEEVEVDKNGVLQVVDRNDDIYYSEIEIENDSRYNATITIGGLPYKFKAHEKRTITINPGSYTIKASAPGVIPYVGTDKVDAGYIYSWRFYTYTTKY